jgi:hypothetical protein
VPKPWLPLALLLLTACREAIPPPGAPRRLESPALQLAFSDLPQACEVAGHEGDRVALACDLEGSTGELTVEVSEPHRVNLLEAARNQQQHYEALPGGVFHGNRELVTPQGPAYTARGRYQEAGAPVEEAQVLLLHPLATDSLVTLRLRYPPGDSVSDRMEQLMFLAGEIEGLPPEGE